MEHCVKYCLSSLWLDFIISVTKSQSSHYGIETNVNKILALGPKLRSTSAATGSQWSLMRSGVYCGAQAMGLAVIGRFLLKLLIRDQRREVSQQLSVVCTHGTDFLFYFMTCRKS